MPGQLTPDQLNDLVDILGGLYGEDIPQQPVEQDAAPQQKAAPVQPAPPTVPQEPMQQAPPLEQPQVPQQPQMPAPMQPQQPSRDMSLPAGLEGNNTPKQPKVKPSPFADHWHKSLLIQTKARRGRRLYTPTVANAPKPPQAKPTKPPSTPTIGSLVYNARPERPPAAQPFQQAETPPPEVPQDQTSILAKVKQEADKKGGEQVGTNLAHVIRTRMVNPSIASQYQAASIFSLDELTKVLNEGHRAAPQEEIDLSQYHDDTSPFVVLSHPRQTLTQGGAPAVVVGEPYKGLVHQLEAAFPGVHFFPAQEAPSELQRAASQVAKPLPAKMLLKSPYAKGFRRIGTKDEGTKPLPHETPDSPAPKPQSRTTPAPSVPNEQPSRQAGTVPLAHEPAPQPIPQTQHKPDKQPNQGQATTPFAEPVESVNQSLPETTGGWNVQNPEDFDDQDSYLTHVSQAALEFAQAQGMSSAEAAYFTRDATDRAEKDWNEYLQESKRHEDLLTDHWLKMGRTAIGEMMKTGEITSKEQTHADTMNVSYEVEFADGTKALFKPAAQEGRGPLAGGRTGHPRMSISRGTFYKREAFVAAAARRLGLERLVPETVLRSIDGKVGSVQHWIDNTQPAAHYYDVGSEAQWDGGDLALLAALDYVFANTDRNTGNWLVTDDGKIMGIDHGLTLPNSTMDITASASIRAMEILRRVGYEKPVPVPPMYQWRAAWPNIVRMAREAGIEEDAIELMKKRLEVLVKHSGKTFADLPAPDESGTKLSAWFPEVEALLPVTRRRAVT